MDSQREKHLVVKGKYNVRAVLGAGPVKSLSIDEIKDDQMVAAAAIDAFTVILQNCQSIKIFDCLNNTIKAPEIIVRHCDNVEIPSIIITTVLTVQDSVIRCQDESTILHVDGDLVSTQSKFEGFSEIRVNGNVYMDSFTLGSIKDKITKHKRLIDLGNIDDVNPVMQRHVA